MRSLLETISKERKGTPPVSTRIGDSNGRGGEGGGGGGGGRVEPYITPPKGGLMEQGYQVEGVHDRDLIPFRLRSKVCGRGGGGGGGGGKVEPYITHQGAG